MLALLKQVNGLRWFSAHRHLAYTKLCCKGIWVCASVQLLPSETFSATLNLVIFYHTEHQVPLTCLQHLFHASAQHHLVASYGSSETCYVPVLTRTVVGMLTADRWAASTCVVLSQT